MQTRTKESRKRLQSLILLTAFTCVLLIVSTYAWFTVQKDVNVSNIRARVEVAEGLQISLDALNWTQVLDLGNGTDEDANASLTETTGFTYMPYAEHRNHVPEELIPVSTTGESIAVPTAEVTANKNASNELGMYVAKYEGDESKKLSSITRAVETETNVSNDAYAGYYAFDIFLKNSSKTGVTKDILQLNSDSSAWVLPSGEGITVNKSGVDITYDGNKASGLQNTIRVAFARYGTGEYTGPFAADSLVASNGLVSADADQDKALAATNQDIGSVAIWEPNHNTHTDHIKTNIGKWFPGGSLPTDPFFTKTLKAGTTTLTNVFDWDDTSLGQPKTVQTTAYDEVDGFTKEGVVNLKDIDGTTDFTLGANSITRLRVYVYLEGQDPDCDNSASRGGGIEVNIGLTKSEAVGSMDRYNELYDPDRTPYTAPVGS